MADPKGFLKVRHRELPPDRPVSERIHDWSEVHPCRPDTALELTVIGRQAGRCMDCGVPFCHFSCPLGNLIPEWNDLVYRGYWSDASDRLHMTNNFPEFTGRLCPAPCESGCVLGINQPATTIKNVEVSIAERAWADGDLIPLTPEVLTGKTVAVIGSGPAGLASAQQLTRCGHTVTVFERADEIGGLLRLGIPEFKMEKWVIDRRLDQMRAEGTRFRTGVSVGQDISLAELRDSYDAVVIAIGSTIPRDLPVPGRELNGVVQAMEYLVPANRAARNLPAEGLIDAAGLDVVVIGGGDTGADCLGTAIRQGARSVTQLEIMPQPPQQRPAHQPWPTYPMLFKVTSAHEEGGERLYEVSTQHFTSDGEGNVAGLVLAQVELVAGRFTVIEGTRWEIPAQLVTLAMGFVGPETGFLDGHDGIELTARGTISRDSTYATAAPGVFVAGDAGRGQSLIVWAIAEGRAAASAADHYLMGSTALPAPIAADAVALRA